MIPGRVNVRALNGVVHDAREWRTMATACGLVVYSESTFAVPAHVATNCSVTQDLVNCMACIATKRTPYAVLCDDHGQRFLTEAQYDQQMSRPDALWRCPWCGESAHWDDDNYEQATDLEEEDTVP